MAFDPVLAVCCSDIHLSLKPPVARSEETSWFDAMARALDQITALAEKHHAAVLCAGDIFDRWNAPAELINFALERLPNMYAIPGNHDLPMHQPELVKRSAYWTLVEAGKITHLFAETNVPWKTPEGNTLPFAGLKLHPFPFNGIASPPEKKRQQTHVALTHEYLWVPGSSYHGAPEESRLGKRAKTFAGFDVVVVGDNHMGFTRKLKNGTTVLNCGTVLRRKSNEAPYQPHVGLIYKSGKVERVPLDTSKDVLIETAAIEELEENPDIANFIEELAGMQATCLNFKDAMKQALDKCGARSKVRDVILEALGESV